METDHDVDSSASEFEHFLRSEPYCVDAGWKAVGGACVMTVAGVGYLVYRLLDPSQKSGPNTVDVLVVGVVITTVFAALKSAKNQRLGEENDRAERIDVFVERYRNLFENEESFLDFQETEVQMFQSWICSNEFRRFLDLYRESGNVWADFDWDGFFAGPSFLYAGNGRKWDKDIIRKCVEMPAFKEFLHSILNFKGLGNFRDELVGTLVRINVSALKPVS